MKMEKEMTPNEKRPQQDCGGMFTQVQASVEILSPVPVSGKCSEKDYERLFIRDPEVKAREGKMAYVRPEYHERIMRITRVIGHDRLTLSAYIDHVLTHHFNQCEDAIKSLYARTVLYSYYSVAIKDKNNKNSCPIIYTFKKFIPAFFIRLGCLLEQLLFVINSVKRIVRMTYQNKFFLFFGINGIILILMYNYIEAADLFTVPKRIERIIRKTYILVFGY